MNVERVLARLEHKGLQDTLPKDLREAFEWLEAYTENSSSFQPKYLKVAFVNEVLSPLKEKVPFQSTNAPLYHVTNFKGPREIGAQGEFKPKPVIGSWTLFSKKQAWGRIADEIGSLDGLHCYVIQATKRLTEVSNPEWLVRCKKYAKQLCKEKEWARYELKGFLNTVDPGWQKEVLVDSSRGIPFKVVASLNES